MRALFRRDGSAGVTPTFGRPAPASTSGQKSSPLEHAVRHRTIRVEHQPIVRLDDGEVVAFGAHARVPSGCPFETPAAMFAAAAEAGLTAELDQVVHAAAYRDVLTARLHPSVSLFVKADPHELDDDPPPDLADLVGLALGRIRVFLEVDAHAMTTAPARTLAGIEKARANGWGIAWDRAEDTPEAFALIPLVRPDVVKMGLALARDHSRPDAARLVDAVRTYAEHWAASIMVTELAGEEDVPVATAVGATLGQGPWYGAPAALPTGTAVPRRPVPLLPPLDALPTLATPYQVLTEARQPLAGTRQMLDAAADALVHRCRIDPEPPAVVVSVPSARPVPEGLLERLALMAPNASFLAVLGAKPPDEPVPGVRFVPVSASDPLSNEWSLAVVGPHFSALLAVRDSGPVQGPFRYSHVLTHDRDLVLRGTRALLSRLKSGTTFPK